MPSKRSKKKWRKRLWTKNPSPKIQFYTSQEWRKLREEVLEESNGRCEICHRSEDDGAKITVAHIKSPNRFPELSLEKANLFLACGECSHARGVAQDDTDPRKVMDQSWRKRRLEKVEAESYTGDFPEPSLAVLMGERMA